MKKLHILFFTIAMLLITNPLHASVSQWEVDKAHSGFYFRIDHIFSTINGFFNDYEVEMVFDPNDLAASKMVFTIKINSIDTNISKRDQHLQTADFFDAPTYPTMRFTSNKITKTGDNSYDVAGVFEIKGVKYDLVLPFVLPGIKEHPMEKNKDVLGFNSRITLDRLVYKVGTGKFAQMGVVGKDVDVLVSLELLRDR